MHIQVNRTRASSMQEQETRELVSVDVACCFSPSSQSGLKLRSLTFANMFNASSSSLLFSPACPFPAPRRSFHSQQSLLVPSSSSSASIPPYSPVYTLGHSYMLTSPHLKPSFDGHKPVSQDLIPDTSSPFVKYLVGELGSL